eukprot:UN25788
MGDGTVGLRIGSNESLTFDYDFTRDLWDININSDISTNRMNLSLDLGRDLDNEHKLFLKSKLDTSNLLYGEYGITKYLSRKKDISFTFSISSSLTQGIHCNLKFLRNNASIKLPILLTEDQSLWSNFTSFFVPVGLYSILHTIQRVWDNRIEKTRYAVLNELGKEIYNAKKKALSEQKTMIRKSQRK